MASSRLNLILALKGKSGQEIKSPPLQNSTQPLAFTTSTQSTLNIINAIDTLNTENFINRTSLTSISPIENVITTVSSKIIGPGTKGSDKMIEQELIPNETTIVNLTESVTVQSESENPLNAGMIPTEVADSNPTQNQNIVQNSDQNSTTNTGKNPTQFGALEQNPEQNPNTLLNPDQNIPSNTDANINAMKLQTPNTVMNAGLIPKTETKLEQNPIPMEQSANFQEIQNQEQNLNFQEISNQNQVDNLEIPSVNVSQVQ